MSSLRSGSGAAAGLHARGRREGKRTVTESAASFKNLKISQLLRYLMKWGLFFVALTVIAAIVWSRFAMEPIPPLPKGVPIEKIAAGRALPQVGSASPLPGW